MNKIEKIKYDQLVEDLSPENMTDEEIVSMWKAPTIQKVHDGLTTFKLEKFLMSKGVSKEFVKDAVKQLKQEAEACSQKPAGAATLITSLLKKILSPFKL